MHSKDVKSTVNVLMLSSSAYVFFFSPSHWCLVPWFTETKPSRPSSHSTWRSWPPPNRRRVQSSRRRPRMLPRQGGGGGASWDTSWLDEVSKQNKKKTRLLPQSLWLEKSRLEGVWHTRARGCGSAALSVWVSGSKTSESQCFQSVCKQPVRGAGPLPPDHDWFSCLCLYVCIWAHD